MNLKALTNLRQKVRKYVKEFEEKIAEYRESPDPPGYETPEEEDEVDFLSALTIFVGSCFPLCKRNFQAEESGGEDQELPMQAAGKEKKKDLSSSESSVGYLAYFGFP